MDIFELPQTHFGGPCNESGGRTTKTCVHVELVALWPRSQGSTKRNPHTKDPGENESDLGRDVYNPGTSMRSRKAWEKGPQHRDWDTWEKEQERRTCGTGDCRTAEGYRADNPNQFRKRVRQLLKL